MPGENVRVKVGGPTATEAIKLKKTQKEESPDASRTSGSDQQTEPEQNQFINNKNNI